MGLRRQVIDTLFGGNRDPLAHIIKRTKGTDVSPHGVVAAPIGTFCCMDYSGNAADDDIYLCTIGSATAGSTTWVLVYDASDRGHLY
jgi:hypothetical protein